MAKPRCRAVNYWAWFSGAAFLFVLVTIHVLSTQKGLRTRKFRARAVSLLSEKSKAAVVDIMGMLGVQNSNGTQIDDSYTSPADNVNHSRLLVYDPIKKTYIREHNYTSEIWARWNNRKLDSPTLAPINSRSKVIRKGTEGNEMLEWCQWGSQMVPCAPGLGGAWYSAGHQVTDRGIWDPAFEDALALPARDTPLPPSEVRGGRRVRPYLAEVGRD